MIIIWYYLQTQKWFSWKYSFYLILE
jgi:hypothetical protein